MKSNKNGARRALSAAIATTFAITAILSCGSALADKPATPAGNIPIFAQAPHIDLGTWFISHGWTNGEHQSCEWRSDALTEDHGKLVLTLSDKGGKIRPIGCGELQTKARYGYGRFEARMKTAAGSGLNTAFFTFIGPPMGVPVHDEIDFEFLGKDKDIVEANYHRKGKQAGNYKIHLGFDATADFHDYAFEWRPDKILWYVDGKLMYETPDGADIPDNPGKIFFSLWSGSKIEDDWMGHFNYKGPVSAEVEWVRYTPLKQPAGKDGQEK